ncbi:hypothetical protein BDZ89DRAFT_1055895 [Hymenopellis radicata]|nr:hypothetical protein BDZ89DRAFT_1055895 [Hymenopellis radicata]
MCIPQELVDAVLAHLDDRETLQNCALAGRCLLPGARTRLFSRITFDDFHTPTDLDLLPLDDIAPYVKEVVYLAFQKYYITPPIVQWLSEVSPLNIQGLTLKSVIFESSSVAFRFLSLFTDLIRFSSFGLGSRERIGETHFTHRVTDRHAGKVSVQNLELFSFGIQSKALLLNDRSPICLCHLKTLELTLTLSNLVLGTLHELLSASRGSLTQLRIVPRVFSNEPVITHNIGLPLRLEHLERIYINIPRPNLHHILLQWLSHAFSGIEGGNLEQLHITILLRNTFLQPDVAILDAGYWRGLDSALSSKSVPYLRSVHVRLAYSSSALSVLLLVRDTIRSACEGLEQRQLLSFELDERRGDLVSDYQKQTEHGLE